MTLKISMPAKSKPAITAVKTATAIAPKIIPKVAAKPVVPVVVPPKIHARISIPAPPIAPKIADISPPATPYPELDDLVDAAGNPIILDPAQLAAVEMAITGQCFSFIGNAGTGKSTIVQAISLTWIKRHAWEPIEYRIKGTGMHSIAPSIAIVAYTNQATDNVYNKLISHPKLREAFGYNVTTVHNLLEYTVEFILDAEGNTKRRYYPQRDKNNKLEITHLIVEEASMVGVGDNSLWLQLFAALPKGVQIVFLGDINQLPPVIGKAILSYALQQLPTTELTTVHRCARDNPIIRQATNCLRGRKITEDYNSDSGQGVRIFHGKKIKYSVPYFEIAIERLLEKMIDAGEYSPAEDMILSPFFKLNDSAVSAQNLARTVASIIARKENKEVYEIIAGWQTIYLSIGDRVYLNKIEGVVTKIETNSLYTGKQPRPASRGIDYWGKVVGKTGSKGEHIELGDEFDYSNLDINAMLDSEDGADEERKRSASHIVHIKPRTFLSEEDEPINTKDHTCSAVGDYASLTLGYALSVHKAQGSEWPNVILALHDSNAILLFRELLYTGMTRARQRLDIIAQEPILEKTRLNQRIKGNSLAAKIEFFNGGYLDQQVRIIP